MQKLKVFYNPNQSTTSNDQSQSPSAGKPKIIAERFSKFLNVEIVSEFAPLEVSDFALAHATQHVVDVLSCQKNNGFNNSIPEVAATFPWTNGSFYAAAAYALAQRTVTMSPTSGFHHAGYASCEGFCTFNGLMIAALKLQTLQSHVKVGIVDIDAHFGNGTQDIINRLRVPNIRHYTFGHHADFTQKKGLFQQWVDSDLREVVLEKFKGCDVLFYQAGADPHVDDPFGGYLTTEQLYQRDKVVFEFAKEQGIPLVWNLAGGYQKPLEKVIEIHENTLRACLETFCE
jgi:acetoin utilization deacetylase AcuC-like enzyme